MWWERVWRLLPLAVLTSRAVRQERKAGTVKSSRSNPLLSEADLPPLPLKRKLTKLRLKSESNTEPAPKQSSKSRKRQPG